MNRPTFVFIDSPYDAHDAVLECIITEGMQKEGWSKRASFNKEGHSFGKETN